MACKIMGSYFYYDILIPCSSLAPEEERVLQRAYNEVIQFDDRDLRGEPAQEAAMEKRWGDFIAEMGWTDKLYSYWNLLKLYRIKNELYYEPHGLGRGPLQGLPSQLFSRDLGHITIGGGTFGGTPGYAHLILDYSLSTSDGLPFGWAMSLEVAQERAKYVFEPIWNFFRAGINEWENIEIDGDEWKVKEQICDIFEYRYFHDLNAAPFLNLPHGTLLGFNFADSMRSDSRADELIRYQIENLMVNDIARLVEKRDFLAAGKIIAKLSRVGELGPTTCDSNYEAFGHPNLWKQLNRLRYGDDD